MTALRTWWPISFLFLLLFALFLQGGASREGLEFHLIIHGLSWAGLTLLMVFRGQDVIKSVPKLPFFLFLALSLWVGITLIPLPSGLVTGLVGESRILTSIETERSLLGLPDSYLTLSYTPHESLRSLMAFGTPLFAFAVVSLSTDKHRQILLGVILALGVLSILLGLAQVFTGRNSPLYFWDFTNWGSPVGIFSNTNHQTSFAALLIPIIMFYIARYWKNFGEGDTGMGLALLLFGIFLLIIIGLVAAGSVAGYGLGLFALLASSILFLRKKGDKDASPPWYMFLAPVLLIGLVVTLVFLSPRLSGLGMTSIGTSETDRLTIYARTADILQDNPLTGTGLGSFEEVYPIYEDPTRVTSRFVNHAHNDWLEWSMELGALGLAVLALFSLWILWGVAKAFFSKENYRGKRMAQAALIALLVPTLHSLVSFPLRPPFYASVFACLLGLSMTRAYIPAKRKAEEEKDKVKHAKL